MAINMVNWALAALFLSSFAHAETESSSVALAARAAIPAGWTYRGCWVDDINNRVMPFRAADDPAMTIESCTTLCKGQGYTQGGVQYGVQCFCGNALGGTATLVADAECNVKCAGNANEWCGGGPRVGVWSPNAVAAPGALPAGWAYRGCWVDDINNRVMTYRTPDNNAMTIESCSAWCKNLGYLQAGVEYGVQCFCSNALVGAATLVPDAQCNVKCAGNANEWCGGGPRIGVWSPNAAAAPGTGVTIPAGWTYRGCWIDDINNRVMPYQAPDNNAMTIESCTTLCKNQGYTQGGVQYGVQCFCGNALGGAAALVADTDCNVKCAGNANEWCGGGPRVGIWSPNAVAAPGAIPAGWTYRGCWIDDINNRVMPYRAPDNNAMTIESCTALCKNQGYTQAGVQYGAQCFCGNALGGAAALVADTDCNVRCAGNANEWCGGGPRVGIWSPNAVTAPGAIPAGWTYRGCWVDDINNRIMNYRAPDNNAMTIESCTTLCKGQGYTQAGVQYGAQCFCSNALGGAAALVADAECNVKCAGNANEWCGGGPRVGIWSPNAVAAPGTMPVGWTYRGCWTDDINNRVMTYRAQDNNAMTLESCASLCKGQGYAMSGAEYGVQCFCSNVLGTNAALVADAQCNVKCAGNANEQCGGGPRISIYAPNAVTAQGAAMAAGWPYRGCWLDDINNRIMTYRAPDDNAMTLESCVTICKGLGYTMAGAQYGVQCFCSSTLSSNAALVADTDCNVKCGGNANEQCGGGPRISMYSPNAIQTTASLVQTVGNWAYQACIYSGTARPAFLIGPSYRYRVNSVTSCLASCQKFGYMAGAMLAGAQCWCGDVPDVAASNAQVAADTDCNTVCPGDITQFCGANNRFAWYKYNGAALYTWPVAQGNGLGNWDVFATGPVVPLIATLGINNKVVFMEKTVSETQGSTGTYELDLVSRAFRTLHVQSDVFCSAGITLPDKAGRQLVIGGWSNEATFGIRLLTPDGVSDWQENYNELHLLAGRWYPTAMIMANGSVLVIGGEDSANGNPTPSLELLPSGGALIDLDWLRTTDPWNLYPFLFVLPGGGILVCYYHICRILEEKTFNTVTMLPLVPGSMVGDFPDVTEGDIGGRTYPLEGTGVIWPQAAPYTDPVTIMMCGGSTPYGAYGLALDNCVSIQPEVAGSDWVIERMPSKRVLSCMCALPDGTFIITCGAYIGTAGFGTQSDPNHQTLLYDPKKPVGSRMTILASDPLDRLYHSEAILLPDGSVLVSGSDPENPGVYIQEFRVEIFTPPYLMGNPAKPSFTIPSGQKSYGYGAQITVNFQGDVGKFTLMGAVSSTHGNSMGQRTFFPAYTCTGNVCKVVTPPNAHICPPGWYMLFLVNGAGVPGTSSWVRIGGDPANFGSWPAGFADFTPPGAG